MKKFIDLQENCSRPPQNGRLVNLREDQGGKQWVSPRRAGGCVLIMAVGGMTQQFEQSPVYSGTDMLSVRSYDEQSNSLS